MLQLEQMDTSTTEQERYYLRAKITAEDVRISKVTPVEVIPAAGVDKVIEVMDVSGYSVTNDDLAFETDPVEIVLQYGPSGDPIITPALFTALLDNYGPGVKSPLFRGVLEEVDCPSNTGVYLACLTELSDNDDDASVDFTLLITYRLHDLVG